MSRKPSLETELRNVKRELREIQALKDQHWQEAMVLRGQLNKSQAETGEWKRRFDMLLEKAKSFQVPTTADKPFELYYALCALLKNTQHVEDGCTDPQCPVRNARRLIELIEPEAPRDRE
jgi:hypothetical protein